MSVPHYTDLCPLSFVTLFRYSGEKEWPFVDLDAETRMSNISSGSRQEFASSDSWGRLHLFVLRKQASPLTRHLLRLRVHGLNKHPTSITSFRAKHDPARTTNRPYMSRVVLHLHPPTRNTKARPSLIATSPNPGDQYDLEPRFQGCPMRCQFKKRHH